MIDYSMLSAEEIEKRHANGGDAYPVGDHAFEDLTDLQNDEFIVCLYVLYSDRTLRNHNHSTYINFDILVCEIPWQLLCSADNAFCFILNDPLLVIRPLLMSHRCKALPPTVNTTECTCHFRRSQNLVPRFPPNKVRTCFLNDSRWEDPITHGGLTYINLMFCHCDGRVHFRSPHSVATHGSRHQASPQFSVVWIFSGRGHRRHDSGVSSQVYENFGHSLFWLGDV